MAKTRMKYWAIRHKPTGYYLPEPLSGQSGKPGYTSTEPCSPEQLPPRLFCTEGGAHKALTWWLKGKVYVSKTFVPSSFLGPEEYEETWSIHEEPERKKEDMEVVPMVLRRLL